MTSKMGERMEDIIRLAYPAFLTSNAIAINKILAQISFQAF